MNKTILSAVLLILTLTACSGTPAPAETPPTLPPADTPTEPLPQPSDTPPPTEPPPAEETPAGENTAAPVSFSNDILPIFENRCIECHGGRRTREGLDMKTYESLMRGSDNGPVLVPGNADASLLVELIVKGEMPNRGPKVTADELQRIIDWVNQGALNN